MALAKQPGEITSYKVLPAALEAMKDVIRARLKLFSNGKTRNSSGDRWICLGALMKSAQRACEAFVGSLVGLNNFA